MIKRSRSFNDSSKASFISATSEGALNGDVPGGVDEFQLVVFPLVHRTDHRRETVNLLLCPHKLLYISFMEPFSVFSKYLSASSCNSLIGWILFVLWPNLTFGTDTGSGGPDGLPDP